MDLEIKRHSYLFNTSCTNAIPIYVKQSLKTTMPTSLIEKV
jgi:hypothetical protein